MTGYHSLECVPSKLMVDQDNALIKLNATTDFMTDTDLGTENGLSETETEIELDWQKATYQAGIMLRTLLGMGLKGKPLSLARSSPQLFSKSLFAFLHFAPRRHPEVLRLSSCTWDS